jgi:rare lipoprotein A
MGRRTTRKILFVALIAAGLPACAQTALMSDLSASGQRQASSRQASSGQASGYVSTAMRQQTRVARNRYATRTETPRRQNTRTETTRTKTARTNHAADGMASYYWQGQRTASGERFNAREMTAAHPTLPFGTKVRVTDVGSGKSVTVRVNDRGPFIKGRVIDVSQAAAESLGMTGKGVTKVKLDVVE